MPLHRLALPLLVLACVLRAHAAEGGDAANPFVGAVWEVALEQGGKPAGDLRIEFGADQLRSPWLQKAGFRAVTYRANGGSGAWKVATQHEEGGRTVMLSADVTGPGNNMVRGQVSIVQKDGSVASWSFKGRGISAERAAEDGAAGKKKKK